MAKSIKIPLTVKLRSGWNTGEWVDVEFARIAEGCGAQAVFLHARSKAMRFSGTALWERIALVKKAVKIPVIGNGDICTPHDAVRMRQETGCNGMMIGRAALGNPWIFRQIKQALAGTAIEEIAPGRTVPYGGASYCMRTGTIWRTAGDQRDAQTCCLVPQRAAEGNRI